MAHAGCDVRMKANAYRWLLVALLLMAIVGVGSAYNPFIIPNFTSNVTSGTVPFTVNFTDTTGANIVKYSQQFNNSYWVMFDSTITADLYTAPDGTNTADALNESNTNNFHYFGGISNLGIGNYTLSTYVKKVGFNQLVQLSGGMGAFTTNQWANYNITECQPTMQTNGTATATDVGNNWCRITWTARSNTVASNYAIFIVLINSATSARLAGYQGNVNKGIAVWGAQVEPGDVSTSYKVTTSQPINASTSWLWLFGDGNNSTLQNPIYTYNVGGIFDVNHSATNTEGYNWINKSAYITANSAPAASFTANTTSGVAPLAVQFNDTSAGSPTYWNWSINGSWTNGTAQNLSHVFTLPGDYPVFLVAGNTYGYNTSSLHNINVTSGGGPTPTPTPSVQCYNQTGNITMYLQSSTPYSLTWSWSQNQTINRASIDGLFNDLIDFDNTTPYYLLQGLDPNSWHYLKIYNATPGEYGRLECHSDTVPPTPFQPIINPSTDKKDGWLSWLWRLLFGEPK